MLTVAALLILTAVFAPAAAFATPAEECSMMALKAHLINMNFKDWKILELNCQWSWEPGCDEAKRKADMAARGFAAHYREWHDQGCEATHCVPINDERLELSVLTQSRIRIIVPEAELCR